MTVVGFVCGICPVNFHANWFVWNVHVCFDCASSHKTRTPENCGLFSLGQSATWKVQKSKSVYFGVTLIRKVKKGKIEKSFFLAVCNFAVFPLRPDSKFAFVSTSQCVCARLSEVFAGHKNAISCPKSVFWNQICNETQRGVYIYIIWGIP